MRGPGRPTLRRVTARSQILGVGLPPALRAVVERHQAHRARTTADRSLARRLRDVARPMDGVAGLAFYVHDGAVSVYGTVDAASRDVVIAMVSGLPGVRRIVDHLQIGSA